ncbi:Hint domain-containing protein [Ruegeria conchae]|uniref:Hint domain-containing protein n=1 Tax=Ruegeria conchae TaxID=981384 RepID=UPI0029C816D4|nr:Hint domain-containing protein [Ruegeria conchae]
MAFDILAHTVNETGQGDLVVQITTAPAIIDGSTISFDGGQTFQTYTYLGQGNYRGTGESGEFIRVGGQVYAYDTLNPTGPMRTGNWKITEGDLDPSNPPCFVGGTLIQTSQGEVPVEDLMEGDLVTTASGRNMPILWVGSRQIMPSMLLRNPSLQPIKIETGVLGNKRPLLISQQHRLLVGGYKSELFFGEPEVLVPAKALIGYPGVSLHYSGSTFTYHHLLLEEHQVVYADGVPSESLFLGDQLGRSDLNEIKLLFPDLFDELRAFKAARSMVSRQEARVLLF